MKRENLIEEYNVTLESLIEKTKFIYSEEFYELDEFEKQKYQKDKLATESHLGTLCNLLWCNMPICSSGVMDFFALSILGFMFGNNYGFGSSTPSMDYLKKASEEDENKENEQVFAIPAK